MACRLHTVHPTYIIFHNLTSSLISPNGISTVPKAPKDSAAAPSPARITTMSPEPATLQSRPSSATPLPPTLSD
ncbi:hypothetical protein CI102_5044 [Trichoderma harzianum]|uniref:Uncharacterized protein n=1 Tax=Trichoderma harzianum CBS 226.95 TaxID=983964 RepID=A0A2T4AV51_TRIHA|nr:hypothetical protein M431DRAFT_503120 [Trichoderma harzianum CBS 226.95]PKK51499.1 hypothetical protein CI102_5044 [Trichoderma harzianum]PTB60946.1 hypothetical protein M431DRAFT_503120 [Trichoderma harzianum CBS 226.95]